MKDPADKVTADLLPAKRGRGRPATGRKNTDAIRARRYRDKRAAEFNEAFRAVYLAGFEAGANGLPPTPPADANAALAYICGGMDGERVKAGVVK